MIRRISISNRVLLVALLPLVGMLILLTIQLTSWSAEVTDAEREALEIEAYNILATRQAGFSLISVGELELSADLSARSELLEEPIFQEIISANKEADEARLTARPEIQTLLGPDIAAIYDRQQEASDALTEAIISGEPFETELEEARIAVNKADAIVVDWARSNPDIGWSIVANIKSVRSASNELIQMSAALQDKPWSDTRAMLEATTVRQQTEAVVFDSMSPELAERFRLLLEQPGWKAWTDAAAEAVMVADGEIEPWTDIQLFQMYAVAIPIAPKVNALYRESVENTIDDANQRAADARSERTKLLVLGITLAVFTVLLTVLIVASIIRPLKKLTDRAQQLANGKLDDEPRTPEGHDELTHLGVVVEGVRDGLNHLSRQVRAIADGDLDDPSLDVAAPGAVGMFVQERVSGLRHTNRAMKSQLATDSLTGVLNRHGLLTALEGNELLPTDGSTEPQPLLFIDLDKFKAVNDEHGHKHGDAVLVAVAGRLTSNCRSSNLIARLGGDEFVVLAHALDRFGIEALTERLKRQISEPIYFEGVEHTVNCSIGIASLEPGDNPAEVIAVADMRMLADKAHRGNIAR